MSTAFLKTKEEIIKWLEKENVHAYELIPDESYGFVVNAKYNVYLQKGKLKEIPVKFNVIEGDFNCSGNQLISLDFSPNKIGGFFDCSHNNLKNLKFCPKYIEYAFYCSGNEIDTLLYFPEIINGDVVYMGGNPILKLFPELEGKMDSSVFFEKHLEEKIKKEMENLNNKLPINDEKTVIKKL